VCHPKECRILVTDYQVPFPSLTTSMDYVIPYVMALPPLSSEHDSTESHPSPSNHVSSVSNTIAPVGCQLTLSTCAMPCMPLVSWVRPLKPLLGARDFLEHTNSHTTESMLIQIPMEYLHLELGTSWNIFDLPYADWEFLVTDCWLKSLW